MSSKNDARKLVQDLQVDWGEGGYHRGGRLSWYVWYLWGTLHTVFIIYKTLIHFNKHNLMKLYIDDIRNPPSTFDVLTRSSRETIDYMENYGCPNYISFDHDLGGDDTSMIIVNYMIQKDMNTEGEFIPDDFVFYVHSANPVGKSNIEGLLNNYINFRKDTKL